MNYEVLKCMNVCVCCVCVLMLTPSDNDHPKNHRLSNKTSVPGEFKRVPGITVALFFYFHVLEGETTKDATFQTQVLEESS